MTQYTTEKADLPVWSQRLRVSELSHHHARSFKILPDPAILRAIAAELDLTQLNKLRFIGEMNAVGKSDWQLSATLGATVQQPCSITLKPVVTRIDVPVNLRFTPDTPDYEAGSEHEMPEDETLETLDTFIDVGEIMVEALVLHVPLYPRAEGVETEDAVFTEPGKTPMNDDDARPFAGLGALRDKLSGDKE